MNTVLITGASGLIARFLINRLAKDNNQIIAVSRNIDLLNQLYDTKNIKCFRNLKDINRTEINTIIHCAFTRKNDSSEVASSLDYAKNVFEFSKINSIKQIINLSSRSVYKEPVIGSLNNENSPISPSGQIGIAKYACELLLDSYFKDSGINFTSLRLASVNELKTDNNMVRPLNVFVDSMLNGQAIKVIGGMQQMSFIDPRDVAEAIVKLLDTNKKWQKVYNVGTGWLCTKDLLSMTKMVIEIGKKRGLKPVELNIEEKQVIQSAGLNIDLIQKDTGWEPKITLEQMIEDLYQMKGV